MTRRRLAAGCGAGCMLAAAVWAGLGLAGSEPPRGKSGSRGAQVLRLVVADSDPATGDLARRLARHVRTLSGGTLRVAVSNASPEDAVARLRSHAGELAIVPADAFPGLGVTSLQALQAPFLVVSAGQAARATAGPLADRLQAGLREVSLTGLALVPEGLYRAFGYLKALELPADFAGVTISTPASRALVDLLRELGARPARPESKTGTLVATGFVARSQQSAEGMFPESAYAAGNLVLFPKVQAIVGSSDALGQLSPPEVAVLRHAAERARLGTIAGTDENPAASSFCAAGGTVVTASLQSLRALRARAGSLLATMRRDPATRALLADIGRLARSARGGPPPCSPTSEAPAAAAPGEYVGPAHGSRPPVGTFRRAFTATQLRAAGAGAAEAEQNEGVVSLTFYGESYGRRFVLEWPGATRPPCRGSVDYPGRRIELRWWPEAPCRGYVAFSWRSAGRGDLAIVAVDPRSEPAWLARAYPGTWKRVDCVPQCGDRGRLSRSETAKLVREELPGGPLVTCHTPAGYAWDYECYVPQRRGGTVSMGERIGVNVDAHGITETSRR